MFSMMSALIALSCAAISPDQGNYKVACNKAFEAGSIQYGVSKKVDDFEKLVTKDAEKRAKKHVHPIIIMAGTALYTAIIVKEARISTGAVPYVESTALVVNQTTATLTFSWSF